MYPLLDALQNPALYDHPVAGFEIIETHISWIVLTGHFAYKLKKPVNLGFVDFSTREQRRFYCEEELRINRRLAGDLYLAVVAIGGTAEHPVLDSGEPAIDYLVKMRQFEQTALLSRLAVQNTLNDQHIDELAVIVADFHRQLPPSGRNTGYGCYEQVSHWVLQNFDQMQSLPLDSALTSALARLRDWTEQTGQRLRKSIEKRHQDGFIRECHGDLHLGNIALIDGRITPFDGIEFNPELRWIDTMSELAFLVMDLVDRGQRPRAFRLLDRYLAITGDYAGLSVLPFYLVYRALVRAKIDLLRLQQSDLRQQEIETIQRDAQAYIDLAQQFAEPPSPFLVITQGVSGSGKTTVSGALLQQLGAIRIRSDVERKRLFGIEPTDTSGSGLHKGIYTSEADQQTYEHLANLAVGLLDAGFPVIIDAAFLLRNQREMFMRLAERQHVALKIVHCTAPDAVLMQRVAATREVTEAGPKVLQAQHAGQDPLTKEEQAICVTVDTRRAVPSNLSRQIRNCGTESPV